MNGKYLQSDRARIPIGDVPLHGEGLFETIRLLCGRGVFLSEHLQRMNASAAELGLPSPPAIAEMENALDVLCGKNGVEDGFARLTLLAGTNSHTTILQVFPGTPYPPERSKSGLRLCTGNMHLGPLSAHKTVSFFPYIFSRRLARKRGYDEMVLRAKDGSAAETSSSNLFIVEGNRVVTPPLDCGILPGVTRKKVLQLAEGLGLSVALERITMERLKSADEIFLTSSLKGVIGVSTVDEVHTGHPGKITESIRRAYLRLQEETVTSTSS